MFINNKKIKILLTIIGVFLIFIIASFVYIYVQNDRKVAVLTYHGILPKEKNTSGDVLITDLETFEKEIKMLKKLGYESMTLEDFYCWKNGECEKKHKSVLITFDDGYYNNYEYAFEVLKKYDMNAVVFAIGSSIKESKSGTYLNIDVLEKIKEEYPNIEIASHSYSLHYPSSPNDEHICDKTYDEVMEDIKKMDNLIETKYYAYPYGGYNDDYVKALKENNFKLAFTFGPGKQHRKADIKDDNLKIPRLNISKDMPMWKFILRLILPM